ncbi:MAG: DNA gyrase inhibitor YacG [Rhodobacteraceae bacterium]|nr:DNA gyrase inhibitor YacG [Paracoccaceae bacterium]
MTCPICKKQSAPEYRPFCSKRCADIDLGKWLNGSYALPAEPEDSSEEAELHAAMQSETRH